MDDTFETVPLLFGPENTVRGRSEPEVLASAAAEILQQQWPRRSVDTWVQTLRASRASLPLHFIALLDSSSGPRVVGHASLHASVVNGDSRNVVLQSLVVDRTLRGHGYGRRLMQALECWAAEAGFFYIRLCTKDQQRFYSACGYRTCEPANVDAPVLAARRSAADGLEIFLRRRADGDLPHPANGAGAGHRPAGAATDGTSAGSTHSEAPMTWFEKRLRAFPHPKDAVLLHWSVCEAAAVGVSPTATVASAADGSAGADAVDVKVGDEARSIQASLHSQAATWVQVASLPRPGVEKLEPVNFTYKLRGCLHELVWMRQIGPSCGLTALVMASDSLRARRLASVSAAEPSARMPLTSAVAPGGKVEALSGLPKLLQLHGVARRLSAAGDAGASAAGGAEASVAAGAATGLVSAAGTGAEADTISIRAAHDSGGVVREWSVVLEASHSPHAPPGCAVVDHCSAAAAVDSGGGAATGGAGAVVRGAAGGPGRVALREMLLPAAVAAGYTADGELFSAAHMTALAEKPAGLTAQLLLQPHRRAAAAAAATSSSVCSSTLIAAASAALDLSTSKASAAIGISPVSPRQELNTAAIKLVLDSGGLILIAYDADSTATWSPCMAGGRKAHWGIICGYVEASEDGGCNTAPFGTRATRGAASSSATDESTSAAGEATSASSRDTEAATAKHVSADGSTATDGPAAGRAHEAPLAVVLVHSLSPSPVLCSAEKLLASNAQLQEADPRKVRTGGWVVGEAQAAALCGAVAVFV